MKISSEVTFRGEVIHQHSSQTDTLSGVIQSLDALQADSNAFLGARVDFDKAHGLYGASTNAKMADNMSDDTGGDDDDESVSGDDQSTSDSAPPLKKKK